MKFLSSTDHAEIQAALDYPIIVHCHLDWDWVWQRPQQLISRLSQRHRVLFVEGPKPLDQIEHSFSRVREIADYPNILVFQTTVPAARWSEGDWIDGERRRLLQTFLAEPVGAAFASPVQWFYDPMAVTAFAGQMKEQAIVYDCMDQLAQFRFAPPTIYKRERELLALADVVFAGGPRMHEEKAQLNPNCFCFGCGVDVDHFGSARLAREDIPADVQSLPGPIFGYVGVVDERLDYELIAALAEANSDGSVVIIGPTAKIDPDGLPQRKNLHWLGARDYALLPRYAAAFNVCLMPFALNEATEFINPTKALEYMATGRPVVSTPVRDVVRQFRDVVSIAHSQREFIAACARATIAPDQAALRRGLKLARENSWEQIVARMEGHVADALIPRSSTAETAA